VLRAVRAPEGTDETRASDYTAERGDPEVAEELPLTA
jgi:SSS family solute:Na+ symporter